MAPASAGATGTLHSATADDYVSASVDENVPSPIPPSNPFLLLDAVACLTVSDQLIDEVTSEALALPLPPSEPPPEDADVNDISCPGFSPASVLAQDTASVESVGPATAWSLASDSWNDWTAPMLPRRASTYKTQGLANRLIIGVSEMHCLQTSTVEAPVPPPLDEIRRTKFT